MIMPEIVAKTINVPIEIAIPLVESTVETVAFEWMGNHNYRSSEVQFGGRVY